MFQKPEEARMRKEEAEKYGRDIDAKNARYENVVVPSNQEAMSADEVPPPLTEEEIKRRVGEQNYENAKDNTIQGSINS